MFLLLFCLKCFKMITVHTNLCISCKGCQKTMDEKEPLCRGNFSHLVPPDVASNEAQLCRFTSILEYLETSYKNSGGLQNHGTNQTGN